MRYLATLAALVILTAVFFVPLIVGGGAYLAIGWIGSREHARTLAEAEEAIAKSHADLVHKVRRDEAIA